LVRATHSKPMHSAAEDINSRWHSRTDF